jgi:hypothetical protein
MFSGNGGGVRRTPCSGLAGLGKRRAITAKRSNACFSDFVIFVKFRVVLAIHGMNPKD